MRLANFKLTLPHLVSFDDSSKCLSTTSSVSLMLANVVPEVNHSEISSAVKTFFMMQVLTISTFFTRVTRLLKRVRHALYIQSMEAREEYVVHCPLAVRRRGEISFIFLFCYIFVEKIIVITCLGKSSNSTL